MIVTFHKIFDIFINKLIPIYKSKFLDHVEEKTANGKNLSISSYNMNYKTYLKEDAQNLDRRDVIKEIFKENLDILCF